MGQLAVTGGLIASQKERKVTQLLHPEAEETMRSFQAAQTILFFFHKHEDMRPEGYPLRLSLKRRRRAERSGSAEASRQREYENKGPCRKLIATRGLRAENVARLRSMCRSR